ncbi:MAG: protein kinase [Desulfobacterales bacterium]|nr:protein kinase [Desulfobacterales bacterium]
MAQKMQNCWEFMKCGREPGGDNTAELGVCPAALDSSFSGINRGKKGGRICWSIAGTFCDGEIQGTFAEKRETCQKCIFFKMVQAEEGVASLSNTFFNFFSQETILNNLTYKYVNAGERFIKQGDPGDTAYIIQRGSCLVIVEKDDELHPVNHLGQGDIVGEMAILTGEPRVAHIEAQTDMELWALDKTNFDQMCKEEPDLLNFLTELTASRFDSRRPTADRAIGKYISTDIIGRGAFSIVYKGFHKTLNMPVAIKMMRHHMAFNPDFLDNFRNEAKVIAGLNHENIIRVYDIEERFRTVFIVMEFLGGRSLEHLLEHLKVLPVPLATDFLLQICSGLSYAHKRNIVHRDMKPANISVLEGDRLKILDFGLACPPGTEDFESLGTLFYMAPEQIEGDPLDQRTDIYALSIIGYEMLTGKRPFPEDNHGALMKMHRTQDIPDPGEILPDLPEALRKLIIKAGRCDPNQRYQNADQIIEYLRPLASHYNLKPSHVSPKKRNISTFFLIYKDEHQLELNRLMEEFSTKVEKAGIVLEGADFQDVRF